MDHARSSAIARQVVQGALQLARIEATELVNSTGLRAEVETEGGKGTVPQMEVWGHAGFTARPQDDAEAIAWTRGDEVIVIATKDRRFEIAIQKGEVALYNMPDDIANQTVIRLQADGNVEVTLAAGKELYVNGGGIKDRVAMQDETQAAIDAVRSAFNSHTHLHGPYVAAVGPAVATQAPLPTLGAQTIAGSPVLTADK